MNTAGASSATEPNERALDGFRAILQAGDAYRLAVAGYFHLGWTEIQALNHLLSEPELSQTELAHRLGITSGASTALVDRLERARMVHRTPHPQDRRRVRIMLTDRCYKMVSVSREWTRQIFDDVPADRLAEVADAMFSIAAQLERQSGLIHAELAAADAEAAG